ncbi:MAG: SDR family oxidoreductase [Candidatus Nanopelagicales bacterium]
MDFHGQTALITGASSGIGAGFARRLAAAGADVVLVARRTDRLEELAAALQRDHGITATSIGADLAATGAAASLVGELDVRGITVDVLINNAGFATHGPFVDDDPARVHDEMALNVVAVVELSRLLVPGMVERRRGAVVNVASTAAFQPVPTMAVYGATKAFVLSFTEALWGELEGTGVRALALCPGATETEFFDVAGADAQVGASRQPVDEVVALALESLEKGRPSVVAGTRNALAARLPRLVPRRQTIRLTRRVMTSG